MSQVNMKIVIASNYINHHEKFFCDAMYEMADCDFAFIQTQEMEEERVKLGWELDLKKIPYCICSYESVETYDKALKLAEEADVMLFGSAPYEFIAQRVRLNKPTFFVAERLFRKGIWHMFYPPTFRTVLQRFVLPGKLDNFYMLCASGYTAFDLHRIHAFRNKCFKWGHFIHVEYPHNRIRNSDSASGPIKLLWVGRMLPLKHPEYAVQVASYLKNKSMLFQMDIIGTGILEQEIRRQIKDLGLSNCVTVHKPKSPTEVKTVMEQTDIFLFTSDFNEGWGAVLGEAMNAGCAVVASHGIGAVPFLVKHGENGLLYTTGAYDEFELCVETLIQSKEMRMQLGKAAIQTMLDLWNPETAAKRFMEKASELLATGYITPYENGPLSVAPVINNNWFTNDTI